MLFRVWHKKWYSKYACGKFIMFLTKYTKILRVKNTYLIKLIFDLQLYRPSENRTERSNKHQTICKKLFFTNR